MYDEYRVVPIICNWTTAPVSQTTGFSPIRPFSSLMAVTFIRTYYARGGQVLRPLRLDSNCSFSDDRFQPDTAIFKTDGSDVFAYILCTWWSEKQEQWSPVTNNKNKKIYCT